MKQLGFGIQSVVLGVAMLATSGCAGGSVMDNYESADASQALAMTANTGKFSGPDTQGRYFLDTCYRVKTKCEAESGGSGQWTLDQDTYKLKAESGKEWKLTKQPDSSLRDENGVTWRFQGRAKSSQSVEQNRAACIQTGKSKVC